MPNPLGRTLVLDAIGQALGDPDTAASSNIPVSEVSRPPSKLKCIGLPTTGGKPGRIPVPSSMAGELRCLG